MPQRFGDRWEIIESLGEGGQAHTYLVKDIQGGGETPYVLKKLKNLNRLDRFKTEIEAVRNLSHPNIVRLIDFDVDAPRPFLVTTHCTGGNLQEALDKGRAFWQNDPLKAIDVFGQVCAGVAHAHSKGITHRDIKPANIFLETPTGPAVVGDFGICYIEDDGERMTITEEAVGARNFMAPEVEDGRVDSVTTAMDVYSLGKLLYWLMSEGRMFSREKHRLAAWDLKKPNDERNTGFDNIYMEHINIMLDGMITHDPRDRKRVENVLAYLPKARWLLEKEFNPINLSIPQPCKYCGFGVYRKHVVDAEAESHKISNFGLNIRGSQTLYILVCDYCGNVQLFRPDLTLFSNSSRMPWQGI